MLNQIQIGNTSADVIKDSTQAGMSNSRLITLELEAPRFLLAQINTHRQLAKNASSSRAISLVALIEQPVFVPRRVGKNKAGMQAETYLEGAELEAFQQDWLKLRQQAVDGILHMSERYGVHKQTLGRLLEPFIYYKGVVTGTLASWQHLLSLRLDSAAQPEFQELAQCIQEAIAASTPQVLQQDEWHLPYIDAVVAGEDDVNIKISASCIAQVSYRKLNDTPEKALAIFDKLGVFGDKPHISPFQHIAQAQDDMAVDDAVYDFYLNDGKKYYAEFGDCWVQCSKFVENIGKLSLNVDEFLN